jgi:hypothetical protein
MGYKGFSGQAKALQQTIHDKGGLAMYPESSSRDRKRNSSAI